MGLIKEFKEFAVRGNVVDMAVGIIIGASFGTIVSSLVNDVLMPPLGMVIGNVDFADLFLTLKTGTVPGPYPTVEAAKEAGAVTLNYGLFINNIISFLIVAFAIFMMIKAINRLKRPEGPQAPTMKKCPYCVTDVAIEAVRCPHCTSDLTKNPELVHA